MAQLPPKVPNWPSSFPHHHHQRLPPVMAGTLIPPSAAASAQPPSWIDEFLDFSSARRGAHRRSASDSIAFLEAAPPILAEECDQNSNGFDRLDDEQLMSMFSDDISLAGLPPPPPPSNPSTPSDQNSNNEDKAMALDQQQQPKNEPGEEESSCKLEPQATRSSGTGDTAIDPKRVKRILANRQSAQRSRVRKLQYISELERSVTSLQGEVSALSPRVAFLDHQRLILNVDNSALKQRIAALAQDKIFKDAHQEALKKEIERLRQVYHQQNLKKMNNNNNNNNAPPPQPPQQPPTPAARTCTDKEQLLN